MRSVIRLEEQAKTFAARGNSFIVSLGALGWVLVPFRRIRSYQNLAVAAADVEPLILKMDQGKKQLQYLFAILQHPQDVLSI